jgi:protease-4
MIGSDTFVEAMRTARESKSIKSIVLRIDSPGGDAAASEAMWREIRLASQSKPVIVSMAGVAASGGYFIAAAGDTIVADPTTITGSIGVFYLHLSMKKFLQEKIGINTQTIETNPHADMYSAMTDGERQIIARQIDTVYRHFLGVVARGRKLSIDSVDRIAQGRVWTGEQAKQIGLVDVLGGLDTAIAIAARRVGLKEGSYSIRILPREKSFLESLSDMFASQAISLFRSRSPLDEYHDLIEAMESRNGLQARMIDVRIN